MPKAQRWDGPETLTQQAACLSLVLAGSIVIQQTDGHWTAEFCKTERAWKALRSLHKMSDEMGMFVQVMVLCSERRVSAAWRLEQIRYGEQPPFRQWDWKMFEREGLTGQKMEELLWSLGWKE